MVKRVSIGKTEYYQGKVFIIPAHQKFSIKVRSLIKDIEKLYQDVKDLPIYLPSPKQLIYKKDKDTVEKLKKDMWEMAGRIEDLRKRLREDL